MGLPDTQPLSAEHIDGLLAKTGLSERATSTVNRLANVWNQYAIYALPAAAVLGYVGEVAANMQLHPDWGVVANIFSPMTFAQTPVDGQAFLNGLLAGSHTTFAVTGIGTVGEVGRKIANNLKDAIIKGPSIIEGRAENPYPQFALMYDGTNEGAEGSIHGDFYQEFYRVLGQHPELTEDMIKKYGPVCEVVTNDVSKPTDIPPVYYFKTTNPANTDFLRKPVHAEKAKATISVQLARSQTVWDPEVTVRTPDEVIDNMNNTITDTLKTGEIKKIVITNNTDVVTHSVFDVKSGANVDVTESRVQHYEKQGYIVISAEEEVMRALKARFQKPGEEKTPYKRIVVVNDGTEQGKRISANWANDYNKTRIDSDPELLIVPEGKLDETLKDGNYNAIFLLGGDDVSVAKAAQAVLENQKIPEGKIEPNYKPVPIEILMEGRGSADKLQKVEEKGGKLHFVHEILAQRCIEKLI